MDWLLFALPEGRNKALVLSYDDGRAADRRLVSLFNQYGLKGTFHLNAGKFGRDDRIAATEVASLYQGHEVSAHSLTHPTTARCPREFLINQLFEDRRQLERLTGYPVRGMSYPNGSWTPEIASLLPQLGLEYARTTVTTAGFDLPHDFSCWPATCHHNDRLLEHAAAFLAAPKAHLYYLMHVWGHSWEFDRDGNWAMMEQFCQQVSGQADIWYASMIEFVDYQHACARLQFTADCDRVYNPSAQSVWLALDGKALEIPAGTLVQLPQGAGFRA